MRAIPSATPTLMRRLALTNLAVNIGIVVTGGLVRLTGSGLGCPTWPQCTSGSYVPTQALAGHGQIEFANRMLTWLLVAVAVATLLAARRLTPRRPPLVRLAWLVLLGIPAQAVLGGITVLTKLNPWTVMSHFLLSMVIIAVSALLWWRSTEEHDTPARAGVSRPILLAGYVTTAAAAVSIALGTVVTGSGPHAGDQHAVRTGFDPQKVTQLHVDSVMVLIGLTVGVWLSLHAVGAPAAARRTAAWLFGLELAQGAIGYTQYFTHLPILLVALHMLGSTLVWIAALRLPLAMSERTAPAAGATPAEETTGAVPHGV